MAYDPVGIACAAVTLFTNAVATALIGYKVWCAFLFMWCSNDAIMMRVRIHRRAMRSHRARGKATQSRALDTLMFVVESGIGYCLLWVRRSHIAFTVASPH